MYFLISNDDGLSARGIQVLAERIRELGEITIAAPQQNCSGASNSLTLDSPIRIREIDAQTFMVSGTPTDCVHIALTGLLDSDPDMVLSGINAGANLGDDVISRAPWPRRWKAGTSGCLRLRFRWLDDRRLTFRQRPELHGA